MASNYLDINARLNFEHKIQQDEQSSIVFIQNLRMQSIKIKEMIDQIERLKYTIQAKDKQICYLKKKQSQSKFQHIKMEQTLSQDYLQRLKLAEFRVQQLEMNKIDLQNCITKLKSEQSNQKFGLKGLRNLHEEQLLRTKLDNQELIKQIEKYKDKYSNCREQCIILRQQIQQYKKKNTQIQYLLKDNSAKQERAIYEATKKWKQLQKQMSKAKQQKTIAEINCKKLQQYVYMMEGDITAQINQYELQMKKIFEQIAKIEDKGIFWKQKYCQLEILVNHIESLRNQWRLNKQSSQFYHKSHLQLQKYQSKISQNDVLNQLPWKQKLQDSPPTIKIRSK